MTIISVFPSPTGTPIANAVAQAAAGDVVIVHDGIYPEPQVTISVSNVKVVAKHEGGAVREGSNGAAAAFIISADSGVEINGFVIQNYIAAAAGIIVVTGTNHRIIGNTVNNTLGAGINLNVGSGHVVWRNRVQNSSGVSGIFIASSSNWIVQNVSYKNTGTGISLGGSNNAIVGNVISENGSPGISSIGTNNNFIYGNTATLNSMGGVSVTSASAVLLRNLVEKNTGNGITVAGANGFLGGNDSDENTQTGIAISSNFNSLEFNEMEFNEMEFNQNYGLVISGNENTAFGNRFKGNKPTQISITGQDNNLF
ncbi:right-handed parallel beta-helix repeat-containing protein [Paenibacillus sp. N3/727]|uniref:right-handed parallel beta-helix repeat-containing protein n=1 Tax=Paenibacillus sp. N3/727 TaxID=2925845 RepID=UPI001F536464|nr:right-handed parallel beta-helix repeat-containing protein [Paenibacillus sp. N3/727]UNK19758.1 right-handed parallel beta-helix repeat-containing protein [Paenibacillus sp. N3/727]